MSAGPVGVIRVALTSGSTNNSCLPATGHGRKVQNYNGTRLCLRNYFPTRKCFVLPPPLGTEECGRMEELPEAALAPRFLQQAAQFCNYVLSSTRLKTLPDGRALTGRGKGRMKWGKRGHGVMTVTQRTTRGQL